MSFLFYRNQIFSLASQARKTLNRICVKYVMNQILKCTYMKNILFLSAVHVLKEHSLGLRY